MNDLDRAAVRISDVAMFREAERRNREFGRFEQANAWRLLGDAFEASANPNFSICDVSCFDRGVFDTRGPKDFDEMPFLVEVSPRLHQELYGKRDV